DDENVLIISTVLQCFFDAVALLLRGNVDKKEALENLDLILLCLDEIVDGGYSWATKGRKELRLGMGEVTELQPIPDAHVAVMKFKFQEISIDVICAFSGIPSGSAASSLRKP
ncbi:coatomer subunit zeta-1-like protein, partial [Tanacetum coccineum]